MFLGPSVFAFSFGIHTSGCVAAEGIPADFQVNDSHLE